MKNFLLIFLLFFFITSSCKNERKYVYPLDKRIEVQRVCRFIEIRGTNRFMVLLGKIYPLNNDGYTSNLQNITTNLEDAGYFCGKPLQKNDYCTDNGLNNCL